MFPIRLRALSVHFMAELSLLDLKGCYLVICVLLGFWFDDEVNWESKVFSVVCWLGLLTY